MGQALIYHLIFFRFINGGIYLSAIGMGVADENCKHTYVFKEKEKLFRACPI